VHVEAHNVDAHLDGDLFLELLFGTMYRTSALPWVPTMITAARQGNYEPLQTPLSVALDESNLSLGMYYALQCGEEVAFESYAGALEAVQALPPQLADHYASRLSFDLCEAWPAGQPDSRENEPVHSDLPVLILSGQYDPITPPEWGRLAAATLSRSLFYEFPGVGHGVMRSNQCGLDIGLQFLADPYAEPDVSCLDTLAAPEFR
jgi:pimeloyl-ACP methyl ester carboxylesterase